MRVIFFGTPQFAADVLYELFQQSIEVVAVVSKPDRPKGRSGQPVPTPVKLAAQAFNDQIPIYQPELASDPAFISLLQSYQADLFVVVAYGEIIKQELLNMPRLACINLHASLLPKYRGAAPIQHALINGEIESGVTIMHMVKKMDAGDMIKQVRVPISSNMTYGELEQELCKIGKKALIYVISVFKQEEPPRVVQDVSQVTFAPKIELENCQMDWNLPAQQLHNLIRGVNPHPGAWCEVLVKGEKKRLKIYRSQVLPYAGKESAGSLLMLSPHQLIIATKDQALELLEVQLEGKKIMQGDVFLRGISHSHLNFNVQ